MIEKKWDLQGLGWQKCRGIVVVAGVSTLIIEG